RRGVWEWRRQRPWGSAGRGLGMRARDVEGREVALIFLKRRVVTQAHRHRSGKTQHPLPVGHSRQWMVDQQRRRLAHAAAHTRTTHAASFARKGQTKLGRTPRTLKTNKATREVAAADKGVEL